MMRMTTKIVCEIEVFLLCAGSECEGLIEREVRRTLREIFLLFSFFQVLGTSQSAALDCVSLSLIEVFHGAAKACG